MGCRTSHEPNLTAREFQKNKSERRKQEWMAEPALRIQTAVAEAVTEAEGSEKEKEKPCSKAVTIKNKLM